MKKLTSILFFCILALNVWSQEKFEGTVYDVGTREALSGVTVQSSLSGILTQTNASGFYSIFLNPINDQQTENATGCQILNNTIYWNFEDDVEIKIFSMEGALILSSSSGQQWKLALPVLSSGYNILTMQTNREDEKFLLFSNGTNIQIVQKTNFSAPAPLHDTSLVFTKNGYYSREFSLKELNNSAKINLLKKAYDSLDYFNELLNYDAYYMLQSSPPMSNYGEVQSIKALYDFVNDEIYYANVKKYSSHFSFAEKFLGYEYGPINFFYSQYGLNHPNRFLNLVTINFHKNIDKYVFEFISYDMVDCEGVEATYRKIMETSFFGDKLFFYANNLRWKDCPDVPMITSEELYLGQNYQALNLEENYGYLRKVEIDDLPTTYLGHHDIILFNAIPNDLSVVSGIITTEFQTALSHINILSHNRHTPNMALRDGWTNPKLDTLLGELVYLKVESDSFYIRKANIDEATLFWQAREPQTTVILEKDVETSGLIELSDANYFSVKTIGGKAANFAELVNLGNIPLPENYFAIPFYYYQQHIISNGIDTIIDNMLGDENFYSNFEYRQSKLAELRDLIIEAPLDPDLASSTLTRINYFTDFSAFKFRSSTNAEDLENFSGAGLYDSFSAKKGSSSKTIDNAIKSVWASLWNLRAFDERDYYKIDQKSVAMGILVHRSFPDEDANGVVITKNLYNVNHGYTINVQYKEYSIVYPEPGILHDQIITYTVNLEQNNYTIEYLTHSNIPALEGQTVLTDEELYELADYCTIIKVHYFDNIPHGGKGAYEDFAVDLEFKFDSQVTYRKIYIKQARIYGAY